MQRQSTTTTVFDAGGTRAKAAPVTVTGMKPVAVVRAIADGRINVARVATDIGRLNDREAAAFLAPLPPILCGRIVRANAGAGDEIPLLAVLPPAVAVQAATVDSFLFGRISEGDILAALREGDDRVIETVLADRTVTIRTANGKREIIIAVDPEVAISYLRTIAGHQDEEWKAEVLNGLGIEFLAFVICAYRKGRLEIEEADWMELADGLGDLYNDALAAARNRHFDTRRF